MSDGHKIIEFLENVGLTSAGVPILNPSTPRSYFVPLLLSRSPDGRKNPSGRDLATARTGLMDLGYVVDFILFDSKARNIEEGLRASLLSSFADHIRNSFFSTEEGRPQVWIDFKISPNEELMRRLEVHLLQVAEIYSLPTISIIEIGKANTPTKTEILSTIRQLAPVDTVKLINQLTTRKLDVPSSDWMSRRLDALRKSDLILRRRDGAYVLTLRALSELGTRKSRRSPDVYRFLALARRSD